MEAALSAQLKGSLQLVVGETVTLTGRTFVVRHGRRGPYPGATYGRWGSRTLEPAPTDPAEGA